MKERFTRRPPTTGIIGHVSFGKTSLAVALARILADQSKNHDSPTTRSKDNDDPESHSE